MAHWGIALSSGPNINFPVVPPAAAALAWKELELAEQYANGALLPQTPSHEILIHAAIDDFQVTPLGAHIIARGVGARNVLPVNRSLFGIPEATPRYSAGTLDMIDEEFGELYIPMPTPLSAISSANAQ